MTEQDLARLLMKVSGLLIVIWSLAMLPLDFLAVTAWNSVLAGVLATIVPRVIPLGVGLYLFKDSARIARRYFVNRPEEVDLKPQSSLVQIEELGVALLGWYCLAEGLIELARLLAYYVSVVPSDAHYSWIASQLVGIVLIGMRLIVGIVLLLGSSGLVTFRRLVVLLRPMAGEQ